MILPLRPQVILGNHVGQGWQGVGVSEVIGRIRVTGGGEHEDDGSSALADELRLVSLLCDGKYVGATSWRVLRASRLVAAPSPTRNMSGRGSNSTGIFDSDSQGLAVSDSQASSHHESEDGSNGRIRLLCCGDCHWGSGEADGLPLIFPV
jgi:hypothetical protein